MPKANKPKAASERLTYTLRLAPELRDQIRAAASADDRDMQSWILRAIREKLEREAACK